jgi:L-amino acid N-acyltransferase YncA
MENPDIRMQRQIIRHAVLDDLPRLVDIYNQAIAARNTTADTIPFAVEERTDWFFSHDPKQHPIYVCERDNQVSGWLSVSPYRGRPALRRTAEISYYVDYACQRQGIGSALMTRVLGDAHQLNKHIYLAILLEWNTASLRLLEKFGFEKWGYLPEVAEFDGRLCGQFYYGKRVWVT